MGGTAQVIQSQTGPRQILGGIKHTQLKTGHKDTLYVYVNVSLGNETLLDSLGK